MELVSIIQEDFNNLERGGNNEEDSVMSRIAARDLSDLDLLAESENEDSDLLEETFLEI